MSDKYTALRAAAERAKLESNDEWGYDTDAFHDEATPEIILALLAEREADKARIAELEEQQRETLRQSRSFREAHDSASEIIRRHESRTIHLVLPTTRLWAGKVYCYESKEILMAIREACAAAGITLETGE